MKNIDSESIPSPIYLKHSVYAGRDSFIDTAETNVKRPASNDNKTAHDHVPLIILLKLLLYMFVAELMHPEQLRVLYISLFIISK